MRYSEARPGRVFVIRLEHGEILHREIERFAAENAIKRAVLIVLGGADKGSRLIVGPEDGDKIPVKPVTRELYGAHEIMGSGTIFPDEEGSPILHLHISCGRGEGVATGCARAGVKVWHVVEVILMELVENSAIRAMEKIGFKLLSP